MITQIDKYTLFCDYYYEWIRIYKEGAIRNVTLKKYHTALTWLKKLIPNLKLGEMNRVIYQKLLNEYALVHERQTTMDFHHLLKGSILDAVDDGHILSDPTRKVIIKGKAPRKKKPKYLSQFELQTLLSCLDLGEEINWDWLLLLIAKTGLRFSEALGLTPKDFDFSSQTLNINKTWAYKEGGGFHQTKNLSSNRRIQIDWQLVMQFAELTRYLPEQKPIFVNGNVYNSTVNDHLARRCREAGVPVISIHGLRHTHASILLFSGVSIASVARRLGHASITTTQKTYLHIIRELNNQDIDIIMRAVTNLH
ncbi:MAG: site-specific integrase [Clostridiaceae bacterium]|nr:site-specific integrase [Clostridiaceae bacterium]